MSERIEAVEVKLAYLEKQMIDLDAVVCELAEVAMAVRDELKELRLTMTRGDDPETERSPADDVPPHY